MSSIWPIRPRLCINFLSTTKHPVATTQQGQKLGLKMIKALDYIAEKVGCYKTILDCSEANEGFYVKCGFKRAGLEMAHYYGS